MGDLVQIRLCGFGGQGIVLAGTILGFAAIYDGRWVCGSSSYGAQARGGYARSEVILSNEPIKFPLVIEPDILIALSQEPYEKYIQNVAKTSVMVVYDSLTVDPQILSNVKQVGVAATEIAIEELNSKQVANIVILGATAALTGVVSKRALISSISENVAEQYQKLNLDALEVGYSLGENMKGET